MSAIIHKLYDESKAVRDYLDAQGKISLRVSLEEVSPKVLLLSVASLFEERVCAIVEQFVAEEVGSSKLVVTFVKNKALERQYSTMFDWEANNANKFFSLFGTEFKSYIADEISKDDGLDEGIKAFMSIGRTRNSMIHSNFADFKFEKTLDDVYRLFEGATYFG